MKKYFKIIVIALLLFQQVPLSFVSAAEEEYRPVEYIRLNQTDYILELGRTEPLVVGVYPVDSNEPLSFDWSSSNSEVVTVDSFGVIKALKSGIANITVRFKDKTATVQVTVPDTPESLVEYQTHIQSIGWQNYASDGIMSGTTGIGKRLEGISINLFPNDLIGSIQYQTHVQSYGWLDWVEDGEVSGTEGEAKRLEAIRIRLTGEMAETYDVYYRVHAQSYGWLDWAKNGEEAGTEGLAKRLEAIEIKVVEKGSPAPGNIDRPYVISDASISYTTHVQKQGWQDYVGDGSRSGTEGQALRLEGIKIQAFDPALSGGAHYRTHVEKEGWQSWKANDAVSGTQGKALRLEAIEIKLTGELAQYYDVYYRVHAQTYGWLGWAKNGASSGTEGLAKRLEGIEIKLVRKGGRAPGNMTHSFVKK